MVGRVQEVRGRPGGRGHTVRPACQMDGSGKEGEAAGAAGTALARSDEGALPTRVNHQSQSELGSEAGGSLGGWGLRSEAQFQAHQILPSS